MELHLVQNLKENSHHDHIPLNLKGNGILVLSVHKKRSVLWKISGSSRDSRAKFKAKKGEKKQVKTTPLGMAPRGSMVLMGRGGKGEGEGWRKGGRGGGGLLRGLAGIFLIGRV